MTALPTHPNDPAVAAFVVAVNAGDKTVRHRSEGR